MTRLLPAFGPIGIATIVAFASPAMAVDTRDMANPERMTEPAKPGARPPAIPGDRKMTRPEVPAAGAPSGVQPRREHPDEGYDATVEERGARDNEPSPASADVRSFPEVMSDILTSARVKMSLALDSRTPAMDINVDTTDGRVTLFGIVPTEESKFAAGADALSIAGVKAVDNTLQVVAEDQKPEVLARDEKIQETLEQNLASYPSMQDVWIDVKNCVARLRGVVSSGREREQAMLAVRKTPGVCQVKDEVRLTAS